MYRIGCKFRPEFKRANGSRHAQRAKKRPKQFRQGRGAWVVVTCGYIVGAQPVITGYLAEHGYCLGVISTKPRRPGTRVNPRALLADYQEKRRLVRWVNSVVVETGWPNA